MMKMQKRTYYDEYLNTLRSSSAMEEAVIKELTDNEQPVTVKSGACNGTHYAVRLL